MRALLVVNPKATTTSPRGRDVLVSALGDILKLDVAQTRARGHAMELGAAAVAGEYDAVIALGGDGTVNEIVNGLMAGGAHPELPAIGIVPGGGTNVFSRALGIAVAPMEATGQLMEALRAGRSRRVSLGVADARWFTFCAGLGVDAAVMELMERRRREGHEATPILYLRCTLNRLLLGTSHRHPSIRLSGPGIGGVEQLVAAFVCNTSPWTYLGSHPITPCPDATFDAGLDVFGARSLGPIAMPVLALQLLTGQPGRVARSAVRLHDMDDVTLTALRKPLPFQVDGDALGDRMSVTLRSVPAALRVIV
ncbi:MAG: diacylglycerol/lipid kinase family protein [Frankiaceae bacterium]